MKSLKGLAGLVVLLAACAGMDLAAAACQVNPNIPKNPPADPNPHYSGLQTPAVISAGSAGLIAQSTLQAVAVLAMQGEIDITGLRLAPQCSNTGYYQLQGFDGSQMGTVTIAARMNPKGTSWYLARFASWPIGTSYLLNGSIILRRGPPSAGHFDATVGYLGLKVTSSVHAPAKFSYLLYGTTAYTATPAVIPFSDHEAVNLSVADLLHGGTVELSGLNFDFDAGSIDVGGQLSNMAGRIFASTQGYVDLDPAVQEHVTFVGNAYSIPDLDLRLVDQGANSAELKPLGIKFGYLAVDADADGFAEIGARFDLRKLTVDNTLGPSADGLPQALVFNHENNQAFVGFPSTLNGRYSHSQLGKILSYHWDMVAVPPGSAATMTAETGPDGTFTPDVVGEYMVSLTVSDGTLSSQDFYVLQAFSGDPTGSDFVGGTATGADVRAHVHKVVHLDGRATENPSETYAWTLQGPAGSEAKIVNGKTATPSFTPDVAGYYVLDQRFGPRQIIAVDETLHFSPAVNTGVSLSGDINSDGLDESIMRDSSGDYVLLAPQGNGLFTTIGSYPESTGGSVSIFDIDGDGLDDLVFTSPGVSTALQQPDHSLGAITSIYSGCVNAIYGPVPLGSSLTKSLFVGCGLNSAAFTVLTPDGSGGYTTTGVAPVIDSGSVFGGIGDLNDDGIEDSVFAGPQTLGIGKLMVVPGNPDGSFGTAVGYSPAPVTGVRKVQFFQMMFGDVNHDGRTDLIASASVETSSAITQRYYLFLQNSSGGLNPGVLIPSAYQGTSHLASPEILDIYGNGTSQLVLLGYSAVGTRYGLLIYPWNKTALGKPMIYPLADQPTDNQMNEFYMSDVNGDGIPDIVVNNTFSHYVLYGAPFPN